LETKQFHLVSGLAGVGQSSFRIGSEQGFAITSANGDLKRQTPNLATNKKCRFTGPGDFFRSVQTGHHMKRIKPISKHLLATFMIVAGTMHFANPGFFLKIMPPYLPLHQELVLLSGVCEILLGVLILIPRYSNLAAWAIIGLLIAVFPANVYLFQNQNILPTSPIIHLLRLPLQGVFILWAFWHTMPAERKA